MKLKRLAAALCASLFIMTMLVGCTGNVKILSKAANSVNEILNDASKGYAAAGVVTVEQSSAFDTATKKVLKKIAADLNTYLEARGDDNAFSSQGTADLSENFSADNICVWIFDEDAIDESIYVTAANYVNGQYVDEGDWIGQYIICIGYIADSTNPVYVVCVAENA